MHSTHTNQSPLLGLNQSSAAMEAYLEQEGGDDFIYEDDDESADMSPMLSRLNTAGTGYLSTGTALTSDTGMSDTGRLMTGHTNNTGGTQPNQYPSTNTNSLLNTIIKVQQASPLVLKEE